MEVYKIFSKVPQRDDLWSYLGKEYWFLVNYKPGEKNYPKIANSYLYAFTQEDEARVFMRNDGIADYAHNELWSCEAEVVKDSPSCARTNYALWVPRFWAGLEFDYGLRIANVAPYGTIWCRWIQPIRKVEW